LIKETPAGVGDYTNFYLGSVTVAGAPAGRGPGVRASLVTIFFALGIARSWELLGPGRGGLISEFADHAGHITRRERGGPADGSPPQQ
jgi:hypothetical protein